MDKFLYDNGLRHERVKCASLSNSDQKNSVKKIRKKNGWFAAPRKLKIVSISAASHASQFCYLESRGSHSLKLLVKPLN